MIKNTVNTEAYTKKSMKLAYFHTPKELEEEESIMGLSTHFLSISRKL